MILLVYTVFTYGHYLHFQPFSAIQGVPTRKPTAKADQSRVAVYSPDSSEAPMGRLRSPQNESNYHKIGAMFNLNFPV